MARCGCAGGCDCVLNAGGHITVTGNGSALSPWQVTADVALVAGTGPVTVTGAGTAASPWKVNVTLASCDAVMDCVGAKVGGGLTFNAATKVVSVKYSADEDNVAGPGTDGGVYAPAQGAAGSVAIATQDSTEIDLVGDGRAGSILTANLRGVRTGDWTVADGTVTVGRDNSVTTRYVGVKKLDGTSRYHSRMYVPGWAAWAVQVLKNDSEVGALVLKHDGQVLVYAGTGQAYRPRPVPWAMCCGGAEMHPVGKFEDTCVVNLPPNRFTVPPGVVIGNTTHQDWAVTLTAASTTSVTLTARNIDKLAFTVNFYVYFMAFQYSPTDAVEVTGNTLLRQAGGVDWNEPNMVSVCRTAGCAAAGLEMAGWVPEPGTRVMCMSCGQPVTDVTMTGPYPAVEV